MAMKHFRGRAEGPGGMSAPVAVVVDVGGTRVRAALAGPDGTPTGRVVRPSDRTSPERFLAGLEEVIRAVLAGAPRTVAARLPVIVGCTGPIGPGGSLVDPPNLDPSFRDLPLGAALGERLRRPVVVGLDTHLALLGEQQAGALRGRSDGIYLTVSTGVGGAILSGGRLLRGARSMSGELGHLPVAARGPRCGCGGQGHLEAVVAGPALGRSVMRRADREVGGALALRIRALGRIPDGSDVALWASEGDPDATAVLRRARGALAVAVTALVSLLDPEVVVLGGGVVLGSPEAWTAACREHIRRHGLAAHRESVEVTAAVLGDDAGLYGGVAYARMMDALEPVTEG